MTRPAAVVKPAMTGCARKRTMTPRLSKTKRKHQHACNTPNKHVSAIEARSYSYCVDQRGRGRGLSQLWQRELKQVPTVQLRSRGSCLTRHRQPAQRRTEIQNARLGERAVLRHRLRMRVTTTVTAATQSDLNADHGVKRRWGRCSSFSPSSCL